VRRGYWYGGYGRVARPRALAYPWAGARSARLPGRPRRAPRPACRRGAGRRRRLPVRLGDLATAAQERLPVTVVLVDDGGYGMLAYDFTKDGDTPIGCDLEPPDFVALAHAFRVHAERVPLDGLAEALPRHLALGAPSMIVVPAALTPPPNTSPRWYRADT
jgi:acetolactate synthase-1/2/3 large subunit